MDNTEHIENHQPAFDQFVACLADADVLFDAEFWNIRSFRGALVAEYVAAVPTMVLIVN